MFGSLPPLRAAPAMQYENQRIEKIDVTIMNRAEDSEFDSKLIQSRIKSKIGEIFCQAVFDNDLKILANEFDRVDPTLECVDDKLYITLKVWPKPTIRTIVWNGLGKIKRSALQEELGIAPCSIYDRRAFNQAFHKLKAYYVKKGFFEAELSYDVIQDPISNEVDIQISVNEGRAGWIKKIEFVNFTDEEEDEIYDMMLTKRYNLFMSWMNDEGLYREEAVQQDEMIILNYLQNLGYADARVSIEVCEAKQKNRIVLVVTVDRGECYSFGNITFKGNTIFNDDIIRSRFLMEEGEPYSPEAIRDSIERITNLYGRRGYIDVVVDYEPKLVGDQCVYDVEFTIEECEQYRVGLIKVFGNWCTLTSVILHETLLIPGEVFNLEKLKATEMRLLNVGFFKAVNVYAVKSEDAAILGENYRDVHIEVEETSTGNFGAFFGYSSSESLFGGFNLTENNFNDAGLTTLGTRGFGGLRGGGQYAAFNATFGTKARSYTISWSKPYFMDTPWTVGYDVERSSNRYVANAYDFETASFVLRGAYPVNAFVRAGLHYRLKNTHFILRTHHHHLSEKLREEARNSGLISAFGGSLTYDSTNHPLSPTRGLKSRGEFELAGAGGRHSFLSCAYLNTYFFQLPSIDTKGVWKARCDLRFIQPIGDSSASTIPLDERFFFGGDATVRGFKPYKLGPLYPHSSDPRGGISMQLLSLEYTYPLFSRLDLFAFADSGHLSMETWHFGQMHTALGYGVKVLVFAGAPPLILGMGYPVNAEKKSQVKRFFMSMGGRF